MKITALGLVATAVRLVVGGVEGVDVERANGDGGAATSTVQAQHAHVGQLLAPRALLPVVLLGNAHARTDPRPIPHTPSTRSVLTTLTLHLTFTVPFQAQNSPFHKSFPPYTAGVDLRQKASSATLPERPTSKGGEEGEGMRGERREGRGGLSGNVAEEAFCLKSTPAVYGGKDLWKGEF